MRKYLLIGLIVIPLLLVGQRIAEADIFGSSLVGWWTMDNAADGSNISDSSGQGHTGYLAAAATSSQVTPGVIGQALKFNGTTQYASTTTPTPIDGLTNLTISFWALQTTSASGKYSPYGDGDGLTSTFIELDGAGCSTCANDRMFFRGATSQSWTTFKNPIGLNKWTFVTIVRTTSAISIYKNGNLFASTNISGSAITAATASGFHIAHAPSGTTGNEHFFPGSIDDFRIYNRALSAAEVRALYYQGISQHSMGSL